MGTDIPFGDVSLCAWAFRERQILLRKLLSTIAQMKQSGYETTNGFGCKTTSAKLATSRCTYTGSSTSQLSAILQPYCTALPKKKPTKQTQAAFLMDAEWDGHETTWVGGPVSLSTSLTDLYSGKGGEATFGQHLH